MVQIKMNNSSLEYVRLCVLVLYVLKIISAIGLFFIAFHHYYFEGGNGNHKMMCDQHFWHWNGRAKSVAIMKCEKFQRINTYPMQNIRKMLQIHSTDSVTYFAAWWIQSLNFKTFLNTFSFNRYPNGTHNKPHDTSHTNGFAAKNLSRNPEKPHQKCCMSRSSIRGGLVVNVHPLRYHTHSLRAHVAWIGISFMHNEIHTFHHFATTYEWRK